MSIYQKGRDLFERLANRGVDLFEDSKSKRLRKGQNIAMIFVGVLNLYVIFLVLNTNWLLLIPEFNNLIIVNNVIKLIMLLIIPAFATTIVGILCLYFQKRSKEKDLFIIILACSIIIFILYSVLLFELEFLMYLYLLTSMALFLVYVNSQKVKLIMSFFLVLFTYLVIACNLKYGPLFPVSEVIVEKNEYYVILVRFFGANNLLSNFIFIFLLITQNTKILDKAEIILEETLLKSNKLLLNILPEKVADELKETGHSEPILFNCVTVFFTDFVGFTKIAENLQPKELVDELDKCFSYFDSVTERYNLEKLKTIGDAFMAVGGIPEPNNTHPIDVCLAALEIQQFMNQMKDIKDQQNLPYWELRLGINTGNVVAGVVGEKKFAYDVWGDTVNTASRMESSGVSGKINISNATHEQVKFLFNCEYRGKVEAKHKGEVDMYFLNGIKPEFSVNGEGRVPNDSFHSEYKELESVTV